MADIKTIKIFRQFLIKNHALNKYCKNVIYYKHKLYSSILETLIHTNDFSLISGTFQWDYTDEKYEYWHELSAIWQNFLRKKK